MKSYDFVIWKWHHHDEIMYFHVLLTIVKRLLQCHHVKLNSLIGIQAHFDLVVFLRHYLMFVDFVVAKIDMVIGFGIIKL